LAVQPNKLVEIELAAAGHNPAVLQRVIAVQALKNSIITANLSLWIFH